MPGRIVRALGVGRGHTVCEVGAGSGYFVRRLGRAVGPRGRVYAIDVEPRLLSVLRDHVAKNGPRNVTPVLALEDDPLLPDRSCDRILVANTYHHFRDRVGYLRRLVRALRPGGRIANVDFDERSPMGPPPGMRVTRAEFLRDARRAGLRLVAEWTFLPYQYILVLGASRRG